MEASYTHPSHPASSSVSHSMPPSVSNPMAAGDASYRRDLPPSGPQSYHGPSPQHHPSHPPHFNYPSTTLPNLPNRKPLPDQQLLVAENGGVPPTSLPLPLGQVASDAPEPLPHSMVDMGRRYTLDVVQQPKRARMCGFGDKDRRPITPPPCIRLIITDAATGLEVDTNDVDYSLYVLNVDLWSADGFQEVNLVRHTSSSPSISTTGPSSVGQAQGPVYNPLPIPAGPGSAVRDPQYSYHVNPQSASHPASGNPNQPSYNPFSQLIQHYGPSNQQQNPSGHTQGHYLPQYPPQGTSYPPRPSTPGNYASGRLVDQPNQVYYHAGGAIHNMTGSSPRTAEQQPFDPNDPRMSAATPIANATGMFTRNLIGSLAASAFRLTDPNDKNGVWFVLQDLSVRTEGQFRLRFSYVNVGAPKSPNGNAGNLSAVVNTGKSPILASCYSDVFTVYSAKKFPGVVESTPLSKCFATQGIKIPIRKDGPSKPNQREYDDDDNNNN